MSAIGKHLFCANIYSSLVGKQESVYSNKSVAAGKYIGNASTKNHKSPKLLGCLLSARDKVNAFYIETFNWCIYEYIAGRSRKHVKYFESH